MMMMMMKNSFASWGPFRHSTVSMTSEISSLARSSVFDSILRFSSLRNLSPEQSAFCGVYAGKSWVCVREYWTVFPKNRRLMHDATPTRIDRMWALLRRSFSSFGSSKTPVSLSPTTNLETPLGHDATSGICLYVQMLLLSIPNACKTIMWSITCEYRSIYAVVASVSVKNSADKN